MSGPPPKPTRGGGPAASPASSGGPPPKPSRQADARDRQPSMVSLINSEVQILVDGEVLYSGFINYQTASELDAASPYAEELDNAYPAMLSYYDPGRMFISFGLSSDKGVDTDVHPALRNAIGGWLDSTGGHAGSPEKAPAAAAVPATAPAAATSGPPPKVARTPGAAAATTAGAGAAVGAGAAATTVDRANKPGATKPAGATPAAGTPAAGTPAATPAGAAGAKTTPAAAQPSAMLMPVPAPTAAPPAAAPAAAAAAAAPAGPAEPATVLQVWFPEGAYKKLKCEATTTTTGLIETLLHFRGETETPSSQFTLCTMIDGMTQGVLPATAFPAKLSKEWKEGTKLMLIKRAVAREEPKATASDGSTSNAVILQIYYEDGKTYTSIRCGETTTAMELCHMISQRAMFAHLAPTIDQYGIFVQDQTTPLKDDQRPAEIYHLAARMGAKPQFVFRLKAGGASASGPSTINDYVQSKTAAEGVKFEDFKLLKVIGIGGYGKVYQVLKKSSKKIYAMKSIKKSSLTKEKLIQHTQAEQRILSSLNHPFLMHLHYSFQTPDKLYFVMDYVNGGELFFHLAQCGVFDELRTRFYVAELVCALGYLHERDVVYRDLKPENVLLDADGHIRLTDFGLAKDISEANSTATICGTAEYLAPEILMGGGYGKAVDWWCLGILTYEMMCGVPPFEAREGEGTNAVFMRIMREELEVPPEFSEAAASCLLGLTAKDPVHRLGGGPRDADEIREHPWFADLSFSALVAKEVAAPFVPEVRSDKDAKYVDEEFLNMSVKEEMMADNASVSEDVQAAFADFSYASEHLS